MTTRGLFGGTFDPVHLGHLHVAREVLRIFSLPRITFVPCSAPPHKSRELSEAGHRLAMLRLALDGIDGMDVSTIEIDRGGVSFTIDTLRRIAAGPPPCAPVFVLGTDALVEIEGWHEQAALLAEFDLIAVDRPGRSPERVFAGLGPGARDRIVPVSRTAPPDGPRAGQGGRIFHVPIDPADISSSQVRELAAAGASLDGLVPAAVARYIRTHRLYRQEEAR